MSHFLRSGTGSEQTRCVSLEDVARLITSNLEIDLCYYLIAQFQVNNRVERQHRLALT